jgi:hypothetical protein
MIGLCATSAVSRSSTGTTNQKNPQLSCHSFKEQRMKKPFNPVIPDYTPRGEKGKKEEIKLTFSPCCNCGKSITDGYYGRYGDGGVCSKTCNTIQEAKPKYPAPGESHVVVTS